MAKKPSYIVLQLEDIQRHAVKHFSEFSTDYAKVEHEPIFYREGCYQRKIGRNRFSWMEIFKDGKWHVFTIDNDYFTVHLYGTVVRKQRRESDHIYNTLCDIYNKISPLHRGMLRDFLQEQWSIRVNECVVQGCRYAWLSVCDNDIIKAMRKKPLPLP